MRSTKVSEGEEELRVGGRRRRGGSDERVEGREGTGKEVWRWRRTEGQVGEAGEKGIRRYGQVYLSSNPDVLHHTDLYTVSVSNGPNYIVVGWSSNSSVLQQQQLRSVQVTLSEECPTQLRPPQTLLSITVLPDEGTSLNATGLGK